MQKTILSFTIGMSLLLTLNACQPKSATSSESNKANNAEQTNQKPTIEVAAKPATISEPAIDAKTCLELSKSMQKVDDTSKIEAIYAIQRPLKSCLPTANNAEVLSLLENYQAMYKRFLGIDLYMDDERFYEIVEALEEGEKIPVEPLKAMSPRIQYLTKLVQSKADVSILYVGEGMFIFHHNLQAMADLFTPYLPKEQREFIQRMAQDNQEIFWNDAAIDVSFDEVIERATFWESYIQRYPNGYFSQDAKILLSLYRHVLFFGSDNTQWTDDAVHEFIEPKYEQLMKQLAKRPNSTLAQDARALLSFMKMPDAKRQQTYPVPEVDEDGYEIQDWSKVRYQLKAALPIPSPWDVRNYRDCLDSITCISDIDADSLDVSQAFASACPSGQLGVMQIQDDLKVWGFNTDFSDKEQHCESLNLKDYAESECQFSMDWNQNPNISIYNSSGWYKGAYENSESCELALKDHIAEGNGKN